MTIDSGLQTIEFHRSFDAPKPLTFSSREDACTWLRHLYSRTGNSTTQFRQFLSRCQDRGSISRLTDDETVQQLADLIYRRQIVVLRKVRIASPGTGSKAAQKVDPPFPLSGNKRRADNTARLKTWISIVLNDSDGNPVAGEDYRIELPDGRAVEGKLDRLGTAAVSGIDPGQCKVSFPRLAGSVWEPAAGGSH
jgi:hypothetical protein